MRNFRVRPLHNTVDDIGVEIIAMHYGIVWGERQRVFSQDDGK